MQVSLGSTGVQGVTPSLFSTFWQAGFECSTHQLRCGRRLDLVDATSHDVLASQDYALLRAAGISTVREGLRWHLIETSPGKYDFSSALRLMDVARQSGVQIIWDLLHFGWPDHREIWHADWGRHFASFAYAFGRQLERAAHDPIFVAPINEISFFSWAGGDVGYLNPHCVGKGSELKKVLVGAALRAADALLASHSVRLVWPEPVIHVQGDPASLPDQAEAARHTASMYEAWDMIAGRSCPELGGHPSYLDVLGINYYPNNQFWNNRTLIPRDDPRYRPFLSLLLEVSKRYNRPLFISETGAEDEDRAPWLAYIGAESRAAQRQGVPLEGICLYPILNHPGWDDDRHCHNGLWDYPDVNGGRIIHQDLARELALQQSIQKKTYDNPSVRHNLSVPSPMELRVSAAATLDEPLCA